MPDLCQELTAAYNKRRVADWGTCR